MLRLSLLFFFILFVGHRLFAQQINSKQPLTLAESTLINQKKPYQFYFGHFFKSDTLYAILLDTSIDHKQNVTYSQVKFYEKVNNKWHKKNEFDSLRTSAQLQSRFSNYNNDKIEDFLVSAGIVGTGSNETEYLFILDTKTKSLQLIKGLENLPSTSYDTKSNTISSVGLASGIPNFEYYKINNLQLSKIGGKEIWTDDKYGYLEKYHIINGKKVIYYKRKRKLPFDLFEW